MQSFLSPLCAVLLLLVPLVGHAAGLISLGITNSISYGPIYCAAANGYYKKYGLDVRLVNFTDNSVMTGALEGDEINAGVMTYDEVVAANAHGWKLKAVMPVAYSVGGDAILANAQIRGVKDLAGRKVAFSPATPADYLLSYALAKNGLTAQDIIAVNTSAEGVAGIMAAGSVEIGVTNDPTVAAIIKLSGGNRFRVLLSARDARGMITAVLVLKDSTIAKDPQQIRGLIRGTMDGLAFMQAEPTAAAAIMSKRLGVPAADLVEQLPSVDNPGLAHLGDVFKPSDSLPSFYVSGKIISDSLKREGQIDASLPIEATFDSSFVDALQANPAGP
jgi:NitT/TauT family transport system substrate-binding protein